MTGSIYRPKHPVQYDLNGPSGSETIKVEQLEMRRPTAGDMLLIDAFQDKPMELSINLIAALSGQLRLVIERLDAEDFGPLADLAFANVGGGPKTGATV